MIYTIAIFLGRVSEQWPVSFTDPTVTDIPVVLLDVVRVEVV